MRVTVTGATGLIGVAVTRALRERGDDVIALTRDRELALRRLGPDVESYAWPDPKASAPPDAALAQSDAVIHLLGEPVAQRWTEHAKAEIRDSRVLATRRLVAALGRLPDNDRPAVLVSQSATGYYGDRADELVDEESPAGDGFLADVVLAWEREALTARELQGMRVAATRTGVVLSAHGGALAKMLPPFRIGLGGPVAGGRQYMPWIHLRDVVGAVLRCLDDQRISGPVNVTAPNPVRNDEFSRTLGRVLHRPAVLPVPGAALRLLYGEMASIVVTGQRVVPARLLQLGHEFEFPHLEPALHDALAT